LDLKQVFAFFQGLNQVKDVRLTNHERKAVASRGRHHLCL